jgi:transcriptional regulator with XRE-family HTH domain
MKKTENTVAENIRRLRLKNQLKQADLAKKLNISRQSLSAYERGITLPDIYLLIEIAELFKISLDELAGRNTGK